MSRLKRLARRAVAYALYYTGALWLYSIIRLRGTAVVLMYHRVLPPSADTFSHRGIIVSPNTFDRQMEFLKRYFQPLTAVQFRDCMSIQRFPSRACLVTFDDGWYDNACHALPILERHRIPAVVFVATAFVGSTSTFWQERLTRLLFAATRSPLAGHDVLGELGIGQAVLATDTEAEETVRRAVISLKQGGPTHIGALIDRLEESIGVSCAAARQLGDDRFLGWSEVRKMELSGLVAIGCHAHTHTPLTLLGPVEARAELIRSQQEINAHGLRDIRMCAYPNGDVDDDIAAVARGAGFTVAFATGRGRVRSSDDPMRLRRVNVHESSSPTSPEFLCLMLGIFG